MMAGIRLDTAAKYVCQKSGWRLSNLPLQKLLYLAQVDFIGSQFGERLIDTAFEAWNYGPVSPDLYHKVKMFGASPVHDVFFDALALRSDSLRKATLDEVCDKFLGLNPGKLIEATHWDHGAWAKKYEPDIRHILITDRDIADEYRARHTFSNQWQSIIS